MPLDAPFTSEQSPCARRFVYRVQVGDEVMNYPFNSLFSVGFPVFLAWNAFWPGSGPSWFHSLAWRVLAGFSAVFWVLVCVGAPLWYWARGVGLKRFDFTVGEGMLRVHKIPAAQCVPLAKCSVRPGWRGTLIEYKGPFGPATDERIFVPHSVASMAEIASLFLVRG